MSDMIILDETQQESNSQSTEQAVEQPTQKQEQKSLMDRMNDTLLSMQNIKIKEKIIFYRLLSTMVNAGMSLAKSIAVLEKQEKNPLFKNMMHEFEQDLRSGKTLSESLQRYPGSFSEEEIGMVRS